jgi:hypothetical protein
MNSRLLRTIDLSCQEKNAMFTLLGNHFEGVKRNIFESDLSNKNWVILLEDKNAEQLKGFSTLLMYNTQFQGENISVVYSGDTIVDPSAWSSSSLSRTWISSVNKLRREYAKGKLYWLLISSGFRTYRFLPIFWREFYPRYDIVTPKNISEIMKFLAQERFGKYYDENAGVVRFPYPQVLGKDLLSIPEERMGDRHIEYFAQKNPAYIKGEELVCITEICEDNLTSAGKRMWFPNTNSLGKNTPLAISN